MARPTVSKVIKSSGVAEDEDGHVTNDLHNRWCPDQARHNRVQIPTGALAKRIGELNRPKTAGSINVASSGDCTNKPSIGTQPGGAPCADTDDRHRSSVDFSTFKGST